MEPNKIPNVMFGIGNRNIPETSAYVGVDPENYTTPTNYHIYVGDSYWLMKKGQIILKKNGSKRIPFCGLTQETVEIMSDPLHNPDIPENTQIVFIPVLWLPLEWFV